MVRLETPHRGNGLRLQCPRLSHLWSHLHLQGTAAARPNTGVTTGGCANMVPSQTGVAINLIRTTLGIVRLPSAPRDSPSTARHVEGGHPTSPETSSLSDHPLYYSDSDESEVDSTSPDVAVASQGPASPDEPHVSFTELMSRLVRLPEIEASQQPGPSTDHFFDVVRGEQSAAIVLPLITTLWQAMVQPWDQPAQPQATAHRYEAMYRVLEDDIPFLIHHPHPNSVVVESFQGREPREHIAPCDKEGRKIDMLAHRVYAASGLGVRISNYEATLARYQYFIMQKLDNVASSLPDRQAELARVFIKEAMQVAVQQLSTT
ncbi:uncharacterized protein LOC123029266 [Varanus komodoensis]|uniref:uncharacterized protein LOC123029266 n=1 Tax=Varanus komodoensis TaxID=61221 RepID=UPI001CF7A3B0|nr:uncharacterized protein LOC123029266 [Varanus komodoensis]